MVTPKGSMSTEGETLQFLSYLTGARSGHPWRRGRCPLCHVIYHSCDKGSWRQSLLSNARCCKVCGRNLITGLTSAASPRVDISSNRKVGEKLGVSLPLLTPPLRRDHPGYCTAEVGNPGGTYELPCINSAEYFLAA
jgi:hypothetical protein